MIERLLNLTKIIKPFLITFHMLLGGGHGNNGANDGATTKATPKPDPNPICRK